MMSNKEPDSDTVEEAPDSIYDMASGFLGQIKFSAAIFIIVMFVILSTDVFVIKVLSKIDGSTDYGQPTFKGTVIQAMFLAIAYMLFDIFW